MIIKKIKISLIVLGISLPNFNYATKILGTATNGISSYCITDSQVYCFDIKTLNIKWKKELYKDSQLISKSVLKALAKNHIHLKYSELSKQIYFARLFTPVNITVNNNRLYLGVRFKPGLTKNSQIIFALFEFDSVFRFVDSYIFRIPSQKSFFTLQPYYEISFTSSTLLLTTLLKNDTMRIVEFEIHRKLNQIQIKKEIYKGVGFIDKKSVLSPDKVVLEPMIYPVNNSNYEIYFQYPFPIFKLPNGKLFDYYELIPFLDSCDKSKKHSMFGLFCYDLNFTSINNKYRYVILSTYLWSDTIFAVVGNNKNHQLELIKYDLKTNKSLVKTLEIKNYSHERFFFYTNHLYSFSIIETSNSVERIRMTKF